MSRQDNMTTDRRKKMQAAYLSQVNVVLLHVH